jgi:hypothetical protein
VFALMPFTPENNRSERYEFVTQSGKQIVKPVFNLFSRQTLMLYQPNRFEVHDRWLDIYKTAQPPDKRPSRCTTPFLRVKTQRHALPPHFDLHPVLTPAVCANKAAYQGFRWKVRSFFHHRGSGGVIYLQAYFV